MAKERNINIAEIEYITKYQEVKTIKEIADDLGRSYEFVRRHIKKVPKLDKKDHVRKLEDSGTVVNTEKGTKVAVMTKLGSEKGDISRKKARKTLPDYVRKITDE